MPLPRPHKLSTRDSVEDATKGRDADIQAKWDGWRCGVEITEDGAKLSNGNDLTKHMVVISEQLSHLPVGTMLDAEAVSADDQWGSAQSVLGGNPKSLQKQEVMRFAIFDIMAYGPHNMMSMPFRERRDFLEAMFEKQLADKDKIWLTPSVPATQENYEKLIKAGCEGGVVKLWDRPYIDGGKGDGHYRVKPDLTVDMVAMEFVAGGGDRGRARGLGCIKVGQYRDGVLKRRGSIGTGFDDAVALDIWNRREELEGMTVQARYFGCAGDPAEACPRTMSYMHFRPDKAPEDCVWEVLHR